MSGAGLSQSVLLSFDEDQMILPVCSRKVSPRLSQPRVRVQLLGSLFVPPHSREDLTGDEASQAAHLCNYFPKSSENTMHLFMMISAVAVKDTLASPFKPNHLEHAIDDLVTYAPSSTITLTSTGTTTTSIYRPTSTVTCGVSIIRDKMETSIAN